MEEAKKKQIVDQFCLTFYGQVNNGLLNKDLFLFGCNVNCEVVYNNGMIELFKSSVPSLPTSTGELSYPKSGPTSADIVGKLAKRYIFVSFPLQLRYTQCFEQTFIIQVTGRVLTKEPKLFGVFRHIIQFRLNKNETFVVQSIFSKIVGLEKVKESGKTNETFFN